MSESINPDFDHWCFAAKSPLEMDTKPLPLLTEMIYSICGNDQEKFTRAVEMLREAFEAGGEEAKARAEKAEKSRDAFERDKYAVAAQLVDTKALANRWQEEARQMYGNRDYWQARAEKAEAAIERIMERYKPIEGCECADCEFLIGERAALHKGEA